MNTECKHIADELFSTLNGEAWYGDCVQKILEGVTSEQALSHPIPSAHSIWELVHHLEAWCKFAYGAVQGISIPGWPDMPQEQDFPPVIDQDHQAWQQAVRSLFANHLKLVEAIKGFGDSRLEATVPGSPYAILVLTPEGKLVKDFGLPLLVPASPGCPIPPDSFSWELRNHLACDRRSGFSRIQPGDRLKISRDLSQYLFTGRGR
jgi:hypothetical protein